MPIDGLIGTRSHWARHYVIHIVRFGQVVLPLSGVASCEFQQESLQCSIESLTRAIGLRVVRGCEVVLDSTLCQTLLRGMVGESAAVICDKDGWKSICSHEMLIESIPLCFILVRSNGDNNSPASQLVNGHEKILMAALVPWEWSHKINIALSRVI